MVPGSCIPAEAGEGRRQLSNEQHRGCSRGPGDSFHFYPWSLLTPWQHAHGGSAPQLPSNNPTMHGAHAGGAHQVQEHCAGHVAAPGGLIEVHIDALQLEVGGTILDEPLGVDAVLAADDLQRPGALSIGARMKRALGRARQFASRTAAGRGHPPPRTWHQLGCCTGEKTRHA
jgi:hypothetical protein